MIQYFLHKYLQERPLFLSLIRAKEAELYQRYLPLKSPVLDVGVGDGFFAHILFTPLRVQPFKGVVDVGIVGIDVKDSRIEEAREFGVYKKLVIYDGAKIPFPDNSFSTVISNCVLEHISNLEFTIREIYRTLRSGGVFLTTVMARPWEENLFGSKILGDFYRSWMRERQIHKNLLTGNQWDQVFQQVGFKIAQRTGYLSSSACALIDICHYLSIPSLISYKLFGKWVLMPQITRYIYPVKYFSRILSEKVSLDQSGALFYCLVKD